MKSRIVRVWVAVVGVVGVAGLSAWALWPAGEPRALASARSAAPAAKTPPIAPDVAPTPEAPSPRDDVAALDCGQRASTAARVDGARISVGEVCDALESIAGAEAGADVALRRRFGPDLLARMIDDALVAAALGAAQLEVGREVIDAEVARLQRERGGTVSDTARAAIAAKVARGALVAARSPEPPSAVEVAAAYDANPGLWSKPASALVEGYVARVTTGAAPSDDAAARAAVDVVRTAVVAGRMAPDDAKVEALARFELEGNGLEPELERAVFGAAEQGTWSESVRTRVGWATVRVLEVRPAVVRPLAEVEPQVRNAVRLRRERDTEEVILAELRAKANIVIEIRW